MKQGGPEVVTSLHKMKHPHRMLIYLTKAAERMDVYIFICTKEIRTIISKTMREGE